MKGLSRMRGNSHVRFLGEGLAVMPSSYPIGKTDDTSFSGWLCGAIRFFLFELRFSCFLLTMPL